MRTKKIRNPQPVESVVECLTSYLWLGPRGMSIARNWQGDTTLLTWEVTSSFFEWGASFLGQPRPCVLRWLKPPWFFMYKDGASSDAESRKFQRGIGLLQHMKSWIQSTQKKRHVSRKRIKKRNDSSYCANCCRDFSSQTLGFEDPWAALRKKTYGGHPRVTQRSSKIPPAFGEKTLLLQISQASAMDLLVGMGLEL